MAKLTEKVILEALAGVQDPSQGRDIVALEMVTAIQIKDSNISFALQVPSHRGPAMERLRSVVQEIAELRSKGAEVLLVTSGAVGIGAGVLALKEVPKKLVDRQACAATGQGVLVALYCRLLEDLGLKGAQVLLTESDFSDRYRYLNLHRTLERLLALGVVPIINENDTVATQELRYGDNDRLAARVAQLTGADLLVLLSDVDGLYEADPRTAPDARCLHDIPVIFIVDVCLEIDKTDEIKVEDFHIRHFLVHFEVCGRRVTVHLVCEKLTIMFDTTSRWQPRQSTI